MLTNLIEQPEMHRSRKIRLQDKTVLKNIVEPCQGLAVVVLHVVGFEQIVDEEGEQCLVVPDFETGPPEIVDRVRGACIAALSRIQELFR